VKYIRVRADLALSDMELARADGEVKEIYEGNNRAVIPSR